MNFKALAASALVATTALFGGMAPAEARTCFDVGNSGSGVICNEYKGTNRYGSVYNVGYADDYGNSTGMTVTCRGAHVVDWNSNGNMKYSQLDALAKYFCAV